MRPLVGHPAPNFNAKDQNNITHCLRDFKGTKLILYFYPKDHTAGCTLQANNLKTHYAALLKQGFAVVGVSTDSVESHKKFVLSQELPFPLLSDTEKKIVQDYGVYGEKKMMGRTYMGIHRTTFIIDEKSRIAHIIPKPTTKSHAEEILALYGLQL